MAVYSFSQGAVQTAYVQYKAYTFSDELNVIFLVWPSSYSDDEDVVANFMQVTQTPADPNESPAIFVLPDATQVSVGMNFFIFNSADSNVTVRTNDDQQLEVIEPGNTFAFYLNDNSTNIGGWTTFQFGMGTSSADANVLAGEGLKAINTTLNTTTLTSETSTLGTVITAEDRANLFVWTGGGGDAFTFPETGDVGNGFYFAISNQGQGSINLTIPNGTVDGGNVTALDPQISCYFITDGNNWFTLGRGQPIFFSYNVGSISLGGIVGNLYLTETQANKTIINFVGQLTADVTVIFPQIAYSWYMSNSTTGDFKVYVQMNLSTLAAIEIPQSERMIFYSDNTNLYSTPTVILPEAGFIFPNGTQTEPSITFQGDRTTGAFFDGQSMAITQKGHFVCDFSYDQTSNNSIIKSSQNFNIVPQNNPSNFFEFSRSGGANNLTVNTGPLRFYPNNSFNISCAFRSSESSISLSGETSTGSLTPFAINAAQIALTAPILSSTNTTSFSVTSPAISLTGNTTVTGNLNVTGNINNSPGPVSFPLPIVLGGTNANNKITGFNNLSPLTTTGDLLSFSAPNNVRIANAGANGKSLISRTGNIPAWNGLSVLQTFYLNVNVPNTVFNVGNLIPLGVGGDTFAFTPKFSNSSLFITLTCSDFSCDQNSGYPGLKMQTSLTGGSPWIVLDNTYAYGRQLGANSPGTMSCSFFYSPNTTSQITFSFVLVNGPVPIPPPFPPLPPANYALNNFNINILEIGGN